MSRGGHEQETAASVRGKSKHEQSPCLRDILFAEPPGNGSQLTTGGINHRDALSSK